MARFWAAVFEAINEPLEISLVQSPELALLGIQEDDQRPRYTKLLIAFLTLLCKKNYSY